MERALYDHQYGRCQQNRFMARRTDGMVMPNSRSNVSCVREKSVRSLGQRAAHEPVDGDGQLHGNGKSCRGWIMDVTGPEIMLLFRVRGSGEEWMGDDLPESLARVHVCVCKAETVTNRISLMERPQTRVPSED